MPRKQRWSRDTREVFLRVLKGTGNVSAAARSAEVSLHNAYLKKSNEKKFSREWDAAMEEALDDLEGELRRRALEGTEKAVYYGGEKVGSVRAYNDNLAMFLLKSRRGNIYGDVAIPGTPKQNTGKAENLREKLLTKLRDMSGRAASDKKSET